MAQYFEGEMWFRAISPVPPNQPADLTRSGGGAAAVWWPVNGTAYLMAGFQESLSVSSVYGRTFSMVSVDLSEFSTFYQTSATVPFIGYRSDGSTVTTTFVTDGVIDGNGPIADFQTFYFDSSFSDLVRLDVPTDGWALDNMVFSIPEPGVGSLLALGGLLLLTRSRRRVKPAH